MTSQVLEMPQIDSGAGTIDQGKPCQSAGNDQAKE